MSVDEVLQWRFAADAEGKRLHCIACPWEAEAAGQSQSSRQRPESNWRGSDRGNDRSRVNRQDSGRSQRSSMRGGDRMRRRDFDEEPMSLPEVSSSSWVKQQKEYREQQGDQ